MPELIEALKTRQGNRSQEEFASEFGITQSALSKIYDGKREIGKELGRRMCERYPDLAPLLAGYFLGLDSTGCPIVKDAIAV